MWRLTLTANLKCCVQKSGNLELGSLRLQCVQYNWELVEKNELRLRHPNLNSKSETRASSSYLNSELDDDSKAHYLPSSQLSWTRHYLPEGRNDKYLIIWRKSPYGSAQRVCGYHARDCQTVIIVGLRTTQIFVALPGIGVIPQLVDPRLLLSHKSNSKWMVAMLQHWLTFIQGLTENTFIW